MKRRSRSIFNHLIKRHVVRSSSSISLFLGGKKFCPADCGSRFAFVYPSEYIRRIEICSICLRKYIAISKLLSNSTIGNSISFVHGLQLAREATHSKEKEEKLNSRGLSGRAVWIILRVFLPRNFLSFFELADFFPGRSRTLATRNQRHDQRVE